MECHLFKGQRSPVVQPIIKTPKSSGRFSFGSQASVESIEPGDNSQRTVSSMSGASSTDTIMASPKKIVSEDMHGKIRNELKIVNLEMNLKILSKFRVFH